MRRHNLQADADLAAAFLLRVGEAVRRHALAGREIARDQLPVAVEGGDTIYGIDRRVESVLVDELSRSPSDLGPLMVIAEGLGERGRLDFSTRHQRARYRVLIDPIDGTRGLMYDKRSAWFLAAFAPDLGDRTRLSDAIASVMVEIPVSKQSWADAFSFAGSMLPVGNRQNLESGSRLQLTVQPSTARSLRGGFAQVSNFFPGTKELASNLMERIASATIGTDNLGSASIFEDQYISTGGQLVELMMGRDRLTCDLRPLFYQALERAGNARIIRGLECHPYDLAGVPLARAAGVIVTDGFGGELDAPFDVSTGMHWIGYANAELRGQIEPVIRGWLTEHLGTASHC